MKNSTLYIVLPLPHTLYLDLYNMRYHFEFSHCSQHLVGEITKQIQELYDKVSCMTANLVLRMTIMGDKSKSESGI